MPTTRLDPADLDPAATYQLMISAIVPRPIAWVGTLAADGVANLAPFSYFMGVGSAPPLVAFSVARARGGALKHTARNVLDTREFSVSIPSVRDLDAMHACSAAWPESEFDAVGIAAAPGVHIAAPRPASSACTLECVLHTALDLESTHLFVGRVVMFLVDDAVLSNGVIDPVLLDPVARLGGDGYAELGRRHARPRATTRGHAL